MIRAKQLTARTPLPPGLLLKALRLAQSQNLWLKQLRSILMQKAQH